MGVPHDCCHEFKVVGCCYFDSQSFPRGNFSSRFQISFCVFNFFKSFLTYYDQNISYSVEHGIKNVTSKTLQGTILCQSLIKPFSKQAHPLIISSVFLLIYSFTRHLGKFCSEQTKNLKLFVFLQCNQPSIKRAVPQWYIQKRGFANACLNEPFAFGLTGLTQPNVVLTLSVL